MSHLKVAKDKGSLAEFLKCNKTELKYCDWLSSDYDKQTGSQTVTVIWQYLLWLRLFLQGRPEKKEQTPSTQLRNKQEVDKRLQVSFKKKKKTSAHDTLKSLKGSVQFISFKRCEVTEPNSANTSAITWRIFKDIESCMEVY